MEWDDAGWPCMHHVMQSYIIVERVPTLLRACTIVPARCERCIECIESRQTQVRLRPVQVDTEA